MNRPPLDTQKIIYRQGKLELIEAYNEITRLQAENDELRKQKRADDYLYQQAKTQCEAAFRNIAHLKSLIHDCDGDGYVKEHECEGCINCFDDFPPSQWD